MNVVEHDNQILTKESSRIEKYLLRIINRYFTIEISENTNNIEAIIVESLTRVKRDILKDSGGVFHINRKTGHITLTVQDFNGEVAFDKNTAFNKDFGNQADTICQGNDSRLFDSRTPLEHIHTIGNIDGLEDKLNNLSISSGKHYHPNKDVLDMLVYTGSKVQIDLIQLEYLEQSLKTYIEYLNGLEQSLIMRYNLAIAPLINILDIIMKYVQELEELQKHLCIWYEEAIKYTDEELAKLRQYINNLLTEEELIFYEDKAKNNIYLIYEDEIPLPNGNINFVRVKEDVTTDIIQDGDAETLKKIFDEGIHYGDPNNNNWIWDDSLKSFMCTMNNEYYWDAFLSKGTYKNYTHRVTLFSNSEDDDAIGVELMYNDVTHDRISLVCILGGQHLGNSTYFMNGCVAYIRKNYTNSNIDGTTNNVKYYAIKPVDNSLCKMIHSTSSVKWNSLSNGITVLVKRNGNNFRIWLKYNQPHTWNSVVNEEIIDIPDPLENPLFDFNLEDFSALSEFVDQEAHYGYACYSQESSYFKDVFFCSNRTEESNDGYVTNVDSTSEVKITLPNDIATNMGNVEHIKFYFRYDEDRPVWQEDATFKDFPYTMEVPIPYMYMTYSGIPILVQGFYNKNGYITAQAKILEKINDSITASTTYKDKVIIVSDIPETYISIVNNFLATRYQLFPVTSAEDFAVISGLMNPGEEYFIDGHYGMYWNPETDETVRGFLTSDLKKLEYFDWAANQPPERLYNSHVLYINKDGYMAVDDCYNQTKRKYIYTYTPRYLSNYYQNPRIYYQVFGGRSKKDGNTSE